MYFDLFRRKDSPQYNARIMLQRLIAVRNFTMTEMAKDIGSISVGTLQRFLGHEIDVRMKTFAHILHYIEAEKYRLGEK